VVGKWGNVRRPKIHWKGGVEKPRKGVLKEESKEIARLFGPKVGSLKTKLKPNKSRGHLEKSSGAGNTSRN